MKVLPIVTISFLSISLIAATTLGIGGGMTRPSYSFISSIPTPQTKYTFYSSTLYGPYNKTTKDLDIECSYTYHGLTRNNACDRLLVFVGEDEEHTLYKYETHINVNTTILDGHYAYISKSIPNILYYIDYGITIKCGVCSNNDWQFYSPLIKHIYPIKQENINPLNYKKEPYEIKNRSFYMNDTEVIESFKFTSFQDYIYSSIFGTIELTDFVFDYLYPLDFKYKSARLLIDDKYNLFPGLNLNNSNYRYIDLLLKRESDKVSINFPPYMGLDENHYIMYPYYVGHTKVSKFYLPKNHKVELESTSFILEVNEMGANKTSFSLPLKLYLDSFFFGDCENADYCVIGGIRR